VRALDEMTVLREGRFRPSWGHPGRQSTLLHCIAGSTALTSGSAYLGDVRLGDLKDRQLTLLRRQKVGLFQAFT